MKIFAPAEYWQLTPAQRSEICNGCGPKGFELVPNTMWGMNIAEACNIHDYMYFVGVVEEDRVVADRVFLNNLLRIIESKTRLKPLLFFRRRRALKYYEAVRHFGGPAFWAGKNKAEEEHEISD